MRGGAFVSCPFGPFRISTETGVDLLPKRRKARGLLALLVAARGAPVARTKAAGLLWDRVAEEQARNSLRQELAAINARFDSVGGSPVEADRTNLRIAAEAVSRSEDFLFVRDGVPEDDVDPSILRRPAYEDLDGLSNAFDQWLREERTLIANKLRNWHERRIADFERLPGAGESVVEASRALLEMDATHERAWRALMRALLQMDDVGQARRELENCRISLREELDLEPAPETLALFDDAKPRRSEATAAAAYAPARPALATWIAPDSITDRGASLLILPFEHDRENRSAQFLSAGVMEGAINNLSAVETLFVIGRGTAVALGARPDADPRALGAEMGVGYVVSGSITTANLNHRIYMELIETRTGAILRSEILNAVEAQIFEIHDQIAQRISAAITPTVRERELQRLRRDPRRDLTSYEHLLLALDKLYALDRSTFQEAGNHLQRAIQLDPGFGAARAYAATWHSFRIGQGWSPDIEADGAAAARLAETALEHDPQNPTALSIKGQVIAFNQRDLAQARTFLDNAVRNAPSNSYAWALRSATQSWTGLGFKAVGDAELSLNLSPLDPFAFFSQHMISQGYYVAGDYELAALWGERSLASNPRLTSNLRILAAAYAALGEMDRARNLADEMMAIEPHFRIRGFTQRTPLQVEIRSRIGRHLEACGLPET
ncbi:MAG: BTAD domain-containing putative transcriptional regulator [Pseudomonadota bacterium]